MLLMRGLAVSLCLAAMVWLVAAPPAGAESAREVRRLENLAIDRMLEGQVRIMRVADRLRVAGVPFCGRNVGPVLGVYAADRYAFANLFRGNTAMQPFVEAVRARFGLGRFPRILAVLPGSPAARAGLRVGDLVTKIDGRTLRRETQLDGLVRSGVADPLPVTVQREAGLEELVIHAPRGCALPARFSFGADVNAFARRSSDLTGMYIYSGMLRFLSSDDDLAVIMGHELGHLVLRHNGFLRTSRRFEADADYLGLYLAARAGFDVSKADLLWDRFTQMSPYTALDWGVYGHPTSPARALALRQILSEIAGKRRRGEPLVPESR